MSLRPIAGKGCLDAHWLLFLAAVAFACPASAQFAGTPQGAATVTFLTGRVDIMRDSQPWVLNIGDTVKPGQLIVTGPDGGAMFKLADGSTFEIYANSQVKFRASQGSWTELLDVFLGNIKVHIQRVGGKPNPNRVRTPTAVISVRGTTFQVNVEDDGDTTFVMVEEGIVDVEHVLLPSKKIPLTDGQAIRVYKNVPLAQQHIDKGSVAQEIARGLGRALYQVMVGRQRGPGGSTIPASAGGAGGGGVGDTRAPDPPPPPPAPPPPPPAATP
jgi:hypothetical protein